MPQDKLSVVISWSGATSKQVASALRDLVRHVIQATEPWVSEIDIGAGSHWHADLWQQLEKAKAGIVCLTPENLDSKWVHFEAGALAKGVEKVCVCPYLFRLKNSDVQGPLIHLQCKQADYKGTFGVLEAINKVLGNPILPPQDLKECFDVHWPKFEKELDDISPSPAPEPVKAQTSSSEQIMEEVLGIVRELQAIVPSRLHVNFDMLQEVLRKMPIFTLRDYRPLINSYGGYGPSPPDGGLPPGHVLMDNPPPITGSSSSSPVPRPTVPPPNIGVKIVKPNPQ